MNPASCLALPLLGIMFGAGCSHTSNLMGQQPAPQDTTTITSTVVQPPTPSNDNTTVSLSEDIVRMCNVNFNNADRAPKFDFDESLLLPKDLDVLDQVARCVMSGPLKGVALGLVGRADPRGEVEYNFVLGERRATSVREYLVLRGVDAARLVESSRGKLDATGTDEVGWMHDRRVDIEIR
jgi:peptidoglycan-associated lipoprotein